MRDLSTSSTAARIGIVLALSAGMAMLSAGGASATGLPPLPTLPAPIASIVATVTTPLTGTSSPVPLPALPAPALPAPALPAAPAPAPAPVPAAPHAPTPAPVPSISILPLNLLVNVPIVGSIPVPKSPLPPIAGVPAPAPLLAGLIQVSTGVKGTLNQIGAAMAPTPLAPLAPNGNPAGLANIVIQASPLATVCVQATGTGTALLNTDLTALGVDIGTPLVQTFPGFLAPCPAGSVPAPGSGSTAPGSTIVGIDTSLGDLVGACVRVTTSIVPIQSTILLLNQDLIAKLTAAGLPLQQLIVPCPSGTATATGGGAAGGGGGGAGGGSGNGGGGGGSDAGSGIPTTGSLAFTGAEIGALMALAAALMAAGVLMVRKARRNQLPARI